MKALFIVVLTFMFGNVGVEVKEFHCPTFDCVHQLETVARTNKYVTRMQLFTEDDYAPLGHGHYVWLPLFDEWLQ